MEEKAGFTAVEAGGKAVWGRCGYEDQRFSSSLPPGLAGLLAVTLRREVRTGSWRLHGALLGYRCSAGVEVGDLEPRVKRDLGEETVSPGGTLGAPPPTSPPPQGTVGSFLTQKGICSLSCNIYSSRHHRTLQ